MVVAGGFPDNQFTEILDLAILEWEFGSGSPIRPRAALNLAFGASAFFYVAGTYENGMFHQITVYTGATGFWTVRPEQIGKNGPDIVGLLLPNGLISCP